MLRPLLIVITLALLAIVLGATIGSTPVSWRDAFAGDETAQAILFRIRLPRVLLAAVIGAVLGVAGLTYQNLLRNPLADPFILGVSGGAACGAAVSTALGLARIPGLVPIVAFIGACAATAAVFVLARRRGNTDPARLLLSGLVLNAFFSALILISFAMSRDRDLTAALRWMMGSLFGASWRMVGLVGALLIAGLAVMSWIANDLRMLAFGEDDARSRGVDVERIRFLGFGAASIMTGAAVAVSGIIGFVGLIVPHLVRLAWRRDYRMLLPLCAFGGAALLAGSDAASRAILADAELPVGAFTALLGVPFFLSLLRREG